MIKRRGRGSGSRGTRLNYGNAGCSGYISGAEARMKEVGHLVFENLRNLGPGASGAWMVFFYFKSGGKKDLKAIFKRIV